MTEPLITGESPGPSIDEAIDAMTDAIRDAASGYYQQTCSRLAAHLALYALRSLPVEQRMEAMGMEPATSWGNPLVVTHYDGEWPNHEQHNRPTWVEGCSERSKAKRQTAPIEQWWVCDPCERGDHQACVAMLNDKDCCCHE